MKHQQIVESQLHCKATAELENSVIEDLLQTDGNLKELLDGGSTEDNQQNGNSATV